MGAHVAFELARAMGGLVAHLFVSASPARHRLHEEKQWGKLSDKELIEDLRKMGGTPAGVLKNEELMGLTLPILRTDYALLEAYAGPSGSRVACPVTAFAGSEDEVKVDAVDAWRAYTIGEFRLICLRGGHFFLEQPDELRAMLDEIIRSLVAPDRGFES
jgi:surfactin synthase thioesterase subunit